jgi:thiol:disulfide interchange protein DsbA
MKSVLTALLAAWIAVSAPTVPAVPTAPAAPAGLDLKIRGKYEIIGNTESLKNVKQIEMLEFFNYSCGHCYRFLETSKRLHAKFKDKLSHKKYPVFWGEQTPYPARAFYIADELGKEEKFTKELFDANFKFNLNIFRPKTITAMAKDFGIEKEMTAGMDNPKIQDKVNKSLELSKQYNANETPTIIINRALKVTPSISGGDTEKMTENLELMFEDILKNR